MIKIKISELKAKQMGVNLQGVQVTEISEVREFTKFGKSGRVANAKIKDDSGEVTLTLWNEEIDMVKAGDKLNVVDGYVNEWMGNLQVTSGRKGKLEKAK
ncbi:hypothetical protein JW868_01420 [Candidatus Woesearchaeota archaeon]|nr:hypothetical protein [Candidatus Woesearchaeota archaeon]